jgi:hypothetical protein
MKLTAGLLALAATILLGAMCLPAAAATTDVPQASWPSTITDGNVTATVYEPQPTSWPDRTTLNATAAVILKKAGSSTPVVGTIDLSAATSTDFEGRWVTITNIRILGTHFPMLNTNQAAQLQANITAVAAKLTARKIPLDTLLLALKSAPTQAQPVATNNTPPLIYYSAQPASLVVLDGQPVLAPISGTGLSFVVNTNWSLFQLSTNNQWYLLDNNSWLTAPNFAGPYKPAGTLPADFSKLPNDSSFADVRKYVSNPAPSGPTPAVFVSTTPAQIIVTKGPPQVAAISGTSLQYVTNTGADLVYAPATKTYYVLFSGRWFSATSLNGPWTYATPNLPPDFALIPPDGPIGDALANVPGTAQAQAAVITAQIPQQASMPRSTTTQVTYVGAPNFQPITSTPMQYAVNTSSQVILAAGQYYACENGAWFVSATPNGPWVLASVVPQVIYTIPPTSPLYPVTYVRIYSVTPTVIVTGYTAGYTLGMVTALGVIVYGTGYYYPPYIIAARVPVYFPYPYTYAGGIAYNPASGAWVRGGSVYGPYGGAGAWSSYNPRTGTYAHGSAVWGPYGGSAHGSFVNPYTGRYGSTQQNWNQYSRWGSSTVTGPNRTINTASASNAYGSVGAFNSSTGAQGAGVRTANGSAGVVKGSGGDVYAGKDGNVYQHSDDGWSKWNNGWQPVTPPATPPKNPPATQNRPQGGMTPPQQAENRPQTPAAPPPQNRPQTMPQNFGGGQNRPTQFDPGTYNQLQSDRSARQGGGQRQQFGGGGFGGGGFGGGGGFRRRE